MSTALAARPAFDLDQKPFAGALVTKVGAYDQTGELARGFFCKRVQRGAGDQNAVMLQHEKTPDLPLEQGAAALDERAVRFERLDQLENAADVLERRGAKGLDGIGREHRSHALVGEEFEQQTIIDVTGDQMGTEIGRAHV